MNRVILIWITALAITAPTLAQETPTLDVDIAPALIRVEHLSGDLPSAFRESCLIVYQDGRYHREIRQQEPIFSWDWDPVVLYDGKLPSREVQKINEIVESPNFRDITGTLGNPDILRDRVLLSPRSAVPDYNVDVLNAVVAHPNGRQVFELLLDDIRVNHPLSSFLEWVRGVEKRGKGRIPNPTPDTCWPHSLRASRVPWEPVTHFKPRPRYTPAADYPEDQRTRKQGGQVLVESVVNVDGTVTPLRVKHGVNAALNQHAMDAVRNWMFVPACVDGIPIAAHLDLEVNFELY